MAEQYKSIAAPLAAITPEMDEQELLKQCDVLVQNFRNDIRTLLPLMLDRDVVDSHVKELEAAQKALQEELQRRKGRKSEVSLEFDDIKDEYTRVKTNFYAREGSTVEPKTPMRKKLSEFVSVHATCRVYAGVIAQKIKTKLGNDGDFDLGPGASFSES